MEMLKKVNEMLNEAIEFQATGNYFFQTHFCQQVQFEIKVQLDYRLIEEKFDKLINFGICPECKTVFYHEDEFKSEHF